jgi:HK97 family phage major capsid protein
MKKKLLALLAKKQELRASKVAMGDKSTDVAELRSLQGEVEAIDEEIRSLEALIAEINEESTNERTAAVNSEIPGIVKSSSTEVRTDETNDMEYRKAFQQFVANGTAIPAELRANATTKTTDIGSAIPTVLVDRIVEKMESTGMILALVTKTSFASGVNIPTSAVKPVATWVGEGVGSDRQKKTTAVITFTQFKLRCEIAMSMESGTMAISAFENAFVKNVVEAMVKAIELSIIDGAGTASPKGILKETPNDGQALDVTAPSYAELVKAEAAIPQAYENNAVWVMTKKTFMSFVGMVDDVKQPIARTNYGIGGNPERTLLGRTVILCGDYLDSYSSTLAVGKVFAFIFNFSDYVLNTIYDMGIQKKQDWDTEDLLTKAVMAVDGKVVDKNSLVILKKKA